MLFSNLVYFGLFSVLILLNAGLTALGTPNGAFGGRFSADRLAARGDSEPQNGGSTQTSASTKTVRAWFPDGTIRETVISVPTRRIRPTRTLMTIPANGKDGGPTTQTTTSTASKPSKVAAADPKLAQVTIRAVLKFPDGARVPAGATLEVLRESISTDVVGEKGVAEFAVAPGTYDLAVSDAGIYELLVPRLVVPANATRVIEQTFTLNAVWLNGTVHGPSNEPVQSMVTANFCPFWLISCSTFHELVLFTDTSGEFTARVSRGFYSSIVASSLLTNVPYVYTRFPDRSIKSSADITITLEKGFVISGLFGRGDGIDGPFPDLSVYFLSDRVPGKPNVGDANSIDSFVFTTETNGSFRALLPAGTYSVSAFDQWVGQDIRDELVLPRLVVSSDMTIGPFTFRYGKLRVRIMDGTTRRPPPYGYFGVFVRLFSGASSSLEVQNASTLVSGFLDPVILEPGNVTIELTAYAPWVDPWPVKAVVVSGKTTTVTIWLPAHRKITGFFRYPNGTRFIHPFSVVARRARDPGFDKLYYSSVRAPEGKYEVIATPGSYSLYFIMNWLPDGWMSYDVGVSSSNCCGYYPLRRSVALGAKTDTFAPLTIPVYPIEVSTVDETGALVFVEGKLHAMFKVPGTGQELEASCSLSGGRETFMTLAGTYHEIVFTPFEPFDGTIVPALVKLTDFSLVGKLKLPITVRQPRVATLVATVLMRSGKPCGFCEVVALNTDFSFVGTTDATGRAKLKVRVGTYNVTVFAQLAPGADVQDIDVGSGILISGSITRTFRLPRETAYSGTVIDPRGKGVPNVIVSVGGFETWTDASGRFVLRGLFPSKLRSSTVMLTRMNPKGDVIYNVELGEQDLTKSSMRKLLLPYLVPLTGRMSSTHRMQSVELRVDNGDSIIPLREQRASLRLPDLSFKFDLWPGYDYRLLADVGTEKSRCRDLVLWPKFFSRNGTQIQKDLQLRFVELKGTLTTPDKKPLVDYRIEATHISWWGILPACYAAGVTDSHGSFSFPVIAGNYTLVVKAPMGNATLPVEFDDQVVGATGLIKSYIIAV